MKPPALSLISIAVALVATSPAGAADSAPPLPEAQAHFKRGVELYDDGDFPAALVEFRRAYDLVPNHRVLYNLGRVATAQHDYAAALRHYRQYLADGGTQLVTARRQEVETEIEKLVGRVGQLRVMVDVAGAEVSVDDLPVGITPLSGPVMVNAGRRRVVATAPNAAREARIVEVAGQETVTVALALHLDRPPPRELAPSPAPLPAKPILQQRARPALSTAERRTWPIVLCWTGTGLLAAGTAVAGLMAMRSDRDLQDLRQSYPVSLAQLQQAQHQTRTAALVADGLLTGTALLTALSLYVTLSGPGENTSLSIGPGAVGLSGRF